VAGKYKYHPDCFLCESCGKIIGVGDSFSLVDYTNLYWLVFVKSFYYTLTLTGKVPLFCLVYDLCLFFYSLSVESVITRTFRRSIRQQNVHRFLIRWHRCHFLQRAGKVYPSLWRRMMQTIWSPYLS